VDYRKWTTESGLQKVKYGKYDKPVSLFKWNFLPGSPAVMVYLMESFLSASVAATNITG